MTPAQRLWAGALALILGALGIDKLLDLDGYVGALAALSLVEDGHAWEAATLLAAVELTGALLLALAAIAGLHARIAFEGGAALALAASIAYAIVVISEYYEGHDLVAGALFGTRFAVRAAAPVLIALVFALMSCAAWLLATAFLLPEEPPPRRRKKRWRSAAKAFKRVG